MHVTHLHDEYRTFTKHFEGQTFTYLGIREDGGDVEASGALHIHEIAIG
jgi:hypothetical protein